MASQCGFLEGDRVRHIYGGLGTVVSPRPQTVGNVRVRFDSHGMADYVSAKALTLLSDDCGDVGEAEIGREVYDARDCLPARLSAVSADLHLAVLQRNGRLYRVPIRRVRLRERNSRPTPSAETPLNVIGIQSYRNACEKGFYSDLERVLSRLDQADRIVVRNLWRLARCALIHSEVSEMVEALRDGAIAGSTSEKGKPEGLPSEIADVIIRLTDFARSCGIDIDRAVEEKAAYNATRPHGHGRSSKL